MNLLWQTIKNNLDIPHSLIVEKRDWQNWLTKPSWRGKPMEKFDNHIESSRQIFNFSLYNEPYLLKIDGDVPERFHQCSKEIKLWRRLMAADKEYFVPIICGDIRLDQPSWIVCPMIEGLYDKMPKESHWKTINHLKAKYDIGDLRPNANWYVHNNRPLIVDYGCNS